MAFIPGYEFIIKNKLGIIFDFYLNEQKHIEYIVSDNKCKWKEKYVVITELTENFYVEIDDKDNIHIISFHSNGNLYYSQYNNKQWQNHLIAQYPVSEQVILYPTIKYVNNQIHIFYYLLYTSKKNKAYLLHLSFDNKNYKTNHITTVYSHSYLNPFKIFSKDDEILILYGSVVNGVDQIFITKLNISTGKLDNSISLSHSKDKKIYIDGLLDNNKTLHIIWSKYDEEHLVVQYLNIDTNKLDIKSEDLNPISLSNQSSCSFPTLVYYKEILWAIWTEVGKIVSCYSIDMGKNWSESFIHEDSRKLNFKRYRYISNSSNDLESILCDVVFGSLYPNIKFLGFGGETDDDIPTS